MPPVDVFGYEVAIQTYLASRRPGKHSSSHTQYELVRKYRTAYSNYGRASPQENADPMILGDDRGKLQRFVKDGCSSYWYSHFAIGCKRRMGQDWRPNKTFSTALLVTYLKQIRFKIADADTMKELNCWIVIGAYSVITYVLSLWGTEGFLLDLGGLRLHLVGLTKNPKYFIIPLMGKVKGEHHDQCHLLPCTFITNSGIKPYKWIQRLVEVK
jgi:hypothetical protein